jgi:hypothetical protein
MCDYCNADTDVVNYEVYDNNKKRWSHEPIHACAEHDRKALQDANRKAEEIEGGAGVVKELWRVNERGNSIHNKGHGEKYGLDQPERNTASKVK